jgi:hypothetical protein
MVSTFRILGLVVAVLMAGADAEAAGRKGKGKRKGKAKQPAAEAQETPPPPPTPEPEAAPPAETETAVESPAAATPTEAPAAAGEPAGSEAAATTSLPAEPEPEPVADTAAPAVAPTVDEGAPATQSIAPAPAPAEEASEMKLRIGVNGGIMMFSPGPSYGLNVSLRAGVRLSELFAVYADAGGGFGLGGGGDVSDSGASVSVNTASYRRIGVMAEVTLGPLFLSVGPALFDGAWAGIAQGGGTSGAAQSVYVADGYFPSAVGRIGLGFGDGGKFTLALEGMVVIGEMTEVAQSGGATGASQSAKTGNSAIGYSPVLVLGWDMN